MTKLSVLRKAQSLHCARIRSLRKIQHKQVQLAEYPWEVGIILQVTHFFIQTEIVNLRRTKYLIEMVLEMRD